MIRSVCVFCGSRPGKNPKYAEAAQELGTWLARQGLRTVYGGGQVGLMGLVADAALAAGGTVVGVIPRSMVDRELAHPRVTQLIVTQGMHERKATMVDLSDAFIALPGGFGTLDELCEIVTWAQLGDHQKPIYLWNVDGYFDPFLAFVGKAVEEGFIKNEDSSVLRVISSISEFKMP